MSSANNHRDDFYRQLAPVYHLKVDWDTRRKKESPLFKHLFDGGTIDSVCDLGCGDGGHAETVVEQGAKYVGIDSSSEMIKMARQNYRSSPNVRFLKGDMLRFPAIHTGKFDLVLMLGNTLPHLQTTAQLNSLLGGVSRTLKAGGRFVIQTVNPARIKSQEIYFLPPKLAKNQTLFTPFYVRRAKLWDFYMPVYVLGEGTLQTRQVPRTRLRFWAQKEITAASAKKKLRFVEAFGDAALSSYAAQKSENMILVLEKGRHA